MNKRIAWILAVLLLLSACTGPAVSTTGTAGTSSAPTGQSTTVTSTAATTTPTTVPSTAPTTVPVTEPTVTTAPAKQKLVVIDPGHQRHPNLEMEPNGPGSDVMKYKNSGGTQGYWTKLWEYELNLIVSFLLRDLLEERGYRVVMIRESHDVDLSNIERAVVANELGADVFIRIHANAVSNPDRHGAMTICQKANNPYNSALYPQARLLAEAVLDELVAAAGCRRDVLWETNSMTGINWCQVPTTIVEMGYMSNYEEDLKLADPEYQQKLALGLANGIDAYFAALESLE